MHSLRPMEPASTQPQLFGGFAQYILARDHDMVAQGSGLRDVREGSSSSLVSPASFHISSSFPFDIAQVPGLC